MGFYSEGGTEHCTVMLTDEFLKHNKYHITQKRRNNLYFQKLLVLTHCAIKMQEDVEAIGMGEPIT